jgi:hypothetical protein
MPEFTSEKHRFFDEPLNQSGQCVEAESGRSPYEVSGKPRRANLALELKYNRSD